MVVVACLVVLVAAALVADRAALRRLAPHAARGLAVGLGVGVVLLAWPVWFALDGPAHLSGLVWPNVGEARRLRARRASCPPATRARSNVFLALGGYEGAPLASAALPRLELSGRPGRRAWWPFGGTAACGSSASSSSFCVACSLGERHGQWDVACVFSKIPVLENVIEQRFMAIGYLAAAVMLAVILDRVHGLLPDWRGVVGALAVTGVALVPMAVTFGARLPFAMRPVTLPRWYREVAPALPPGRVLLSVPGPVLRAPVRHGLAGGQRACTTARPAAGDPRGWCAGPARPRPASRCSSALAFGLRLPLPEGTPAQDAAVRHALAVWQVNTVVIATDPGRPLE